jgi:hypothetical protein
VACRHLAHLIAAGHVVERDGDENNTIEGRMYSLLRKRPETKTWTQREFAEHLQCSASAVAKTGARRALMQTREEGKAAVKARSPALTGERRR